MSRSINRVKSAAAGLGLDIEVDLMPVSTRSAKEAALACKCFIDQIVKSLVFEGTKTGQLKLCLVSGRHELNLTKLGELLGEQLKRADPKRVRAETGFAIGGVAPFGHLHSIETWLDQALLEYTEVWAAAGTPNAVFRINPARLLQVLNMKTFSNDNDSKRCKEFSSQWN